MSSCLVSSPTATADRCTVVSKDGLYQSYWLNRSSDGRYSARMSYRDKVFR